MDSYMIPMDVKHTIKDLRIRAGLSQIEAAKRMHISRQTLQRWENDPTKLSVSDINRISDFYKIPTDYIFFGPNTAFSVISY